MTSWGKHLSEFWKPLAVFISAVYKHTTTVHPAYAKHDCLKGTISILALICLLWQDNGLHSRAVISTNVSQQDVSGFESRPLGLSVWSFYVHLINVWVPSGHYGFLPQAKLCTLGYYNTLNSPRCDRVCAWLFYMVCFCVTLSVTVFQSSLACWR